MRRRCPPHRFDGQEGPIFSGTRNSIAPVHQVILCKFSRLFLMSISPPKGQRLRRCVECQKEQFVRKDNQSIRCQSCACRAAGKKGLAVIRSKRIRWRCETVLFDIPRSDANAVLSAAKSTLKTTLKIYRG
jgi:hypothetical protein